MMSDSSGSMSIHKEEYDGSRSSSSSAKREHESPLGKSELDRLAPFQKNYYVKSMSESEVEEHRRRQREIKGKNVPNAVKSFSNVNRRGSQCPEISLKQKASSSRGHQDKIDIGLRGQRTQGYEDEEQVRFALALSAFLAIRLMNFNDGNDGNDGNVNDIENNENNVNDEINFDENNGDADDDESNDGNVDDRDVLNAIARQRDIENGSESSFDLLDMSTYKIFNFIQFVLYAIVSVLMLVALTEYVSLRIFNGDGYNFFLLMIGAIGSLVGTVLPSYIRSKLRRHVYSPSFKGFAYRVALMVLDIVLFVLTTLGAVRLIRSLKGLASLLPLGFNLGAAIVLRITNLNDADHGYTDMLIALFVGKVDEECKHYRHRDMLVNISAVSWITFRVIGMMVMSEIKGEKYVKIRTTIRELNTNLLILEGKLPISEENRRIFMLTSESLYKLRKLLREV